MRMNSPLGLPVDIIVVAAAMNWIVKAVSNHKTDGRPVFVAVQMNRQGGSAYNGINSRLGRKGRNVKRE